MPPSCAGISITTLSSMGLANCITTLGGSIIETGPPTAKVVRSHGNLAGKGGSIIDDGITASGSVEPEEEAPAGEPIQLKEKRVFAQIGERGEQQEHRRWVLDTGASNHMTGAAFSELDSRICKMVKFDDGSIVEIEGRSTILFVGKGGKYHKLTGVYFISRLKA